MSVPELVRYGAYAERTLGLTKDSFSDPEPINPLALTTFGFLVSDLGIWVAKEDETTSWSVCHATITTSWSAFVGTISTTWTECD